MAASDSTLVVHLTGGRSPNFDTPIAAALEVRPLAFGGFEVRTRMGGHDGTGVYSFNTTTDFVQHVIMFATHPAWRFTTVEFDHAKGHFSRCPRPVAEVFAQGGAYNRETFLACLASTSARA